MGLLFVKSGKFALWEVKGLVRVREMKGDDAMDKGRALATAMGVVLYASSVFFALSVQLNKALAGG